MSVHPDDGTDGEADNMSHKYACRLRSLAVTVLWINGAFGAGKSTTSMQLARLLPEWRIFDPETVGYMLETCLGQAFTGDFQDWPSWRDVVIDTIDSIIRRTGLSLICPQTVLDERYMDSILTGLRDRGHTVHHIFLDVEANALISRIQSSADAIEWRMGHVEHFIKARKWLSESADFRVDVVAMSPKDVAECILEKVSHLGQK